MVKDDGEGGMRYVGHLAPAPELVERDGAKIIKANHHEDDGQLRTCKSFFSPKSPGEYVFRVNLQLGSQDEAYDENGLRLEGKSHVVPFRVHGVRDTVVLFAAVIAAMASTLSLLLQLT